MSSVRMKCPKCGAEFTAADYVNGEWTEFPEPWECLKCGSLIVVDREKGYGLKVKPPERQTITANDVGRLEDILPSL